MTRFTWLASTTAVSALTFMPADVVAEQEMAIDVPSQPLASAIAELGRETGLQVGITRELASQQVSTAVVGTMTPREALSALLVGTDVRAESLGEDGVVLTSTVAPDVEDGAVVLDQLLVTARRTEESIFDVPASVIVFSGDQLEQSGIENTREVIQATPNVSFTGGGTSSTIQPSIRGFSNTVGASATSPSVGVFVDGVIANPSSVLAGIGQSTLDLERVETVLGPQNNNFGRGTVGGAINFVTRKPTDEFEASFEGEIGSFIDGKGTLILNQPLLDDGLLSARLAFSGSASDGFVRVAGEGPDELGSEDYNLRFSLRSRPMDRLTLDGSFSFDRSEFDEFGAATFASITAEDPVFPGGSIGEQSSERFLIKGDAAYDFDVGTVILRGSYLKNDVEGPSDADFTPLDALTTITDTETDAISGEIRFQGEEFTLPGGLGTASVNLGASVSFIDVSSDGFSDPGQPAFDFFFAGTPLAGALDDGSSFATIFDQEVFSFGTFVEGRWAPIPRFELAAGFRFSLDAVEQSGETVSTGLTSFIIDPVPEATDSETFTAFTPNASIRYDWTDDISTYFSFTTGFRAGGFFTLPDPFGLATFDQEDATQFEGGVRGSFFDDRLFVSASGFLLNVDDFQTTVFTDIAGVTFVAVGNADARSVGAEVQLVARPIDGLTLSANYGYLDAEFTDFTDSPEGDLTGTRLPASPEHTVNVSAEYAHPVDALFADAFIRGEFTYQTDFLDAPGTVLPELDEFGFFNLRAGLRGDDFQVTIFVENLLDEGYATSAALPVIPGLPGAETVGVAGPERRFGISGKWFF
ncbi:MAG: TonB-dependent receptor [Pseudomonadota bacterium]